MIYIDEDAVLETITRFPHVTREDIVHAQKIMDIYEKNLQRIKQKRRKERDAIKYQAQFKLVEETNPERCFCREKGIKVDHKYGQDDIVDHYVYYSPLDHYRRNPMQGNYYRCPHCGKRYTQMVGIA